MMLHRAAAPNLVQLDSVELAFLCAHKREDSDLWSEFLRRFTCKIKSFIQGTLRQDLSSEANPSEIQETDLFQNTILRLVENSCAALKRFSGTTEAELLAYLAVISRSVVRDCLRRQRARKRFYWPGTIASGEDERSQAPDSGRGLRSEDLTERKVLAREVEQLGVQTIRNHSGEPDRDQLIFQLYFLDGLSTAQIAACEGIGLSKTGVEKLLNRVRDRVRSAANSVHLREARES